VKPLRKHSRLVAIRVSSTYVGVSGEAEGDGADERALARPVGPDDEVEARAGAADEAVVGHEVEELDLHDVPRHVVVLPALGRRRAGGELGALGGARGRHRWREAARVRRLGSGDVWVLGGFGRNGRGTEKRGTNGQPQARWCVRGGQSKPDDPLRRVQRAEAEAEDPHKSTAPC